MDKAKKSTKLMQRRWSWFASMGSACALGIGILFSQNALSFTQATFLVTPPPLTNEKLAAAGHTETAVVAGGCFWGVQGLFQHVHGVVNAVSGYAGGARDTARYEQVGQGTTGHAESVQITYDPSQITYGQLLQVLFSVAHDPTELNRQGPDVGTQYRSAIFPTSDTQRKIAEDYIAQLNRSKVFHAPVVTQVEKFQGFYPAEEYHQNFLTLNPDYPYIVVHDLPKVDALKRLFPSLYSNQPALVKLASGSVMGKKQP